MFSEHHSQKCGLVVSGCRSHLLRIPWHEITFCAFQVALNGRSGLRMVARHAPDLILLDMHLPDLSGPIVLRRIRRLAPETPLLVMTSRRDLQSLVTAVDLGVTAVLTPPIDVRRLFRRLRCLMRRRALHRILHMPPSPGALALGEAALDRLRSSHGVRLSVLGLATTLGVSPRQLRRATHEAYGVPIKMLMVRKRVELALERLRRTEEPIKAIAVDLGFHDAAHMTHTVRRLTGVPPHRHREHALPTVRPWLEGVRTAEQGGPPSLPSSG